MSPSAGTEFAVWCLFSMYNVRNPFYHAFVFSGFSVLSISPQEIVLVLHRTFNWFVLSPFHWARRGGRAGFAFECQKRLQNCALNMPSTEQLKSALSKTTPQEQTMELYPKQAENIAVEVCLVHGNYNYTHKLDTSPRRLARSNSNSRRHGGFNAIITLRTTLVASLLLYHYYYYCCHVYDYFHYECGHYYHYYCFCYHYYYSYYYSYYYYYY